MPATPRSGRLRRLSRWIALYQPDLIAVLGLGLLVAAGVAAALGWFESACQRRPFACGFGQSIVVTSAIAALGYYALLGAKRTRCLRRYRATFRAQAARLTDLDGHEQPPFPSQQRVLTDLRYTLEHDGERTPLLLVGDAGSGKTRILVELAVRLLDDRRLPVLVTARQLASATLTSAALDTFIDAVGSQLRTRDEGEAVFRQLARGVDIVVLVDSLADVDPHLPTAQRDARLADLVGQAREAGYRVVIGTRPSALPEGLQAATYRLPPLDAAEARDLLVHQLGPDQPLADPTTIPPEARSRFFLALLVEHLAEGHPPPQASDAALWRDELVAAWVDDHLARSRPAGVKDPGLLPDIAYVLLVNNVGSIGRQDLVAALQSLPHHRRGLLAHRVLGELQRAIDERLMEFVPSVNHYRFRHVVLQTSLAGLAIARHPTLFDADLVASFGPSATSAVASGLRACPDARTFTSLATRLTEAISRAWGSGSDLLPQLCIAAVQGCRGTTADLQTASALVRTAVSRFPEDASPAARIAFVEALRPACGRLLPAPAGSPGYPDPHPELDRCPAVQAMWRFAADTSAPVRWVAVQRLAHRAFDATAQDLGELETLVRRLETAGPAPSGPDHELAPWLLPSFVELAPPAITGPAIELLERVLAATRDAEDATHLEAALGRGFKLAALTAPTWAPSPAALKMLEQQPRFWYARISLVHALGIRVSTAPGAAESRHARQVLGQLATADPHPLVRRSAELMVEVVRAGRAWSSVAWDDLGQAMRQPPDMLEDRAVQLLGDVALLLTMTACARPEAASDEQRRRWERSPQLPRCLGASPRREELEQGCPPSCGVGLCPYPPPKHRDAARGELSLAFVRRQRQVADRLGRPDWAGRGPSLAPVWERLAPTISSPSRPREHP